MDGKFFLDTNIIVYSFDHSKKKEVALDLIKRAHTRNGCISYQVIQEFIHVALKKFERPVLHPDLQLYMHKILFPICEVFPSEKLYTEAIDISERWKYSFYDSLIIASALEAQCSILYSEDLQNNQKIRNMIIVNPFVKL
jgi:predicted nucleic acid-binding protein